MLRTAKNCLSIWWILCFISLFLWYRNIEYDRIFAVFVFSIGLINLVEYGVFSGVEPLQSGRLLFILLWLQCLLLALGTFIFFKSKKLDKSLLAEEKTLYQLSSSLLLIFSILFILALLWAYTHSSLSIHINENSGIDWKMNESDFLGDWIILYIMGILAPFFLLLSYYRGKDISLFFLLGYVIFSGIYASKTTNSLEKYGLWNHYMIGFGLLAWYLGTVVDRYLKDNNTNKKENDILEEYDFIPKENDFLSNI